MITTHVLDTARGRPAAGIAVRLERRIADAWELVGRDTTGDDGRATHLGTAVEAADHRLRFDTSAYYAETFFPEVTVHFTVTRPDEHHHVPLLLSPFGYTTYRGS